MPDDGKNEVRPAPQGLAGGPGPTPPGVDDGTPRIEKVDEDVPGAAPGEVGAEQEAGRRAARRAGPAGGAERGDPEEPDES